MAISTLSSSGMRVPVAASISNRPIGNQHKKSDRTMVVRRRAMVASLDPVFFEDDMELERTD